MKNRLDSKTCLSSAKWKLTSNLKHALSSLLCLLLIANTFAYAWPWICYVQTTTWAQFSLKFFRQIHTGGKFIPDELIHTRKISFSCTYGAVDVALGLNLQLRFVCENVDFSDSNTPFFSIFSYRFIKSEIHLLRYVFPCGFYTWNESTCLLPLRSKRSSQKILWCRDLTAVLTAEGQSVCFPEVLKMFALQWVYLSPPYWRWLPGNSI